MKWKKGVKLEKTQELWLRLGKMEKQVSPEDAFIAKLVDEGVSDDEQLLELVSKESGDEKLAAGFRLGQFVEDYAEFIAEGEKNRTFGE
ncbi:MAG: hypothetical protein K6G01_06310 [Eubacterium sp.]|nr:hypothetical protein [Eubacterium sp.]